MTLCFRVLGSFEVDAAGRPVDVGGPKQRRLLAALVLAHRRTVPFDDLVAAVWPDDPPASAGGTVQAYVSRLRALLAPAAGVKPAEVIDGGAGGYTLQVGEVDEAHFSALHAEGLAALRSGRSERGVALLDEAKALWRGPLLADLELWPDAAAHRRRLSTAYDVLLDARCDAHLSSGRAADVLPELQERVAGEPLREEPYRQLMVALDSCGRQADALAVYATCRRVMRRELGVEPGERLRGLHAELLTRPAEGPGRPGNRLPEPTHPLLGRGADLTVVDGLLRGGGALTITGPAGAGKTRLAVELARRWRHEVAEGAWYVDLTAARDGADVARAVAHALEVLEQPHRDLAGSVAEALSRRELLLVLDNCEHVVEACADLVTTLLKTAPAVRVVATSQEPLRVDGELVHRLAPLAVPVQGAGVDEVVRTPSVRLFAARAQEAQPGFAVAGANAEAVARVCRELDGMPLALELAAATLRAVDVVELAERLPDRFAVLSRGPRSSAERHRSLQAAVSWGYELLSPQEKQAFAQLSVFAGGFTLDAAEHVCLVDGEHSTVVLLSALVDKSFVQAAPDRSRYWLLETLRLHGVQRLAESGREQGVRTRHAQWVLALCQQAAFELRGPRQLDWVRRLDAERDNVAAALRWSLERDDAPVGLGVAATLWWYWWRNGHIPEGAEWAARLLERFPEPSALRAAALVGGSHLWWKLGEFDRAERACAQALDLVDPADPLACAARGVRAMVLRDRGDISGARTLLESVLQEYADHAEPWGQAATLNMLVSVDRDSHDLELAAARLERSAALFADLGDVWGQAWSAWLLGRVATRQGDLARGAEHLRHSIVLADELRHRFGVVLGLAGLAGVAAAKGDVVVAARLLGATDAMEHAMGVPVRAIEREDSAHDVAVTRSALGPVAYREHWMAGCRLPPDRAVEEALAYRP